MSVQPADVAAATDVPRGEEDRTSEEIKSSDQLSPTTLDRGGEVDKENRPAAVEEMKSSAPKGMKSPTSIAAESTGENGKADVVASDDSSAPQAEDAMSAAATDPATDNAGGDEDKSSSGSTDARNNSEEKRTSPENEKPTLPQRPLKKARTAYFIFADEKRAELLAAHKGEGVAAIARATGQLWSNLDPEDKEAYQNRAAEERERVSKEMEALRAAGLLPTPSAGGDVGGGDDGASLVYPVARIRKICKADPEVRGISKESALLITKAAELFTGKLGTEVASFAQMQNRRKLLPEDVAEVCSTKEQFLFLRDDMRDLLREQIKERKKAADASKCTENRHAAGSKPLTAFFSSAGS